MARQNNAGNLQNLEEGKFLSRSSGSLSITSDYDSVCGHEVSSFDEKRRECTRSEGIRPFIKFIYLINLDLKLDIPVVRKQRIIQLEARQTQKFSLIFKSCLLSVYDAMRK